MSHADQYRVPTVSRATADTLIELVYDPEKRVTALVVSRFGGLWNIEHEVRIETGEVLVPYAATNNLIRNECVVLPSMPVNYGVKNDLVADVRGFIHRYLDVSPGFEEMTAYYVLLTWVYDRFGELPYLRLRGEYGTGKTRALLVIGSLCNKAFFASGASTTSPIFHTLDAFGATLILDEADFPYSDAKADLVKVFNNGTVPGLPVLRCVPNKNKEYNPAAFKVFGPKVVAMRERFQDEALESRFLTEDTGMRPLRPDVPLSLPRSFKTEALQLRNRLLHFRLCEYFNVSTDPTAELKDVAPRLNQSALPLLSLVDDPEARQRIEVVLRDQDETLRARREEAPEVAVLRAVAEASAASDGAPLIQIREIAVRFNAANADDYGSPVSNKWIGYMLRSRLHLTTRKSNGTYGVPTSEQQKIKALVARLGIDTERVEQPVIL